MIANIFQAFFSFKRNLKWFSFNPAQNFQSSIKANHIFSYMKKSHKRCGVESRDNYYWEFAYRKWFFFLKKSNIWYYTHLSTSVERPMVDVCKLRKIGKGFFYRDTFLPFFCFRYEWYMYAYPKLSLKCIIAVCVSGKQSNMLASIYFHFSADKNV